MENIKLEHQILQGNIENIISSKYLMGIDRGNLILFFDNQHYFYDDLVELEEDYNTLKPHIEEILNDN